jgi:sulfur carrier protein ThiS
VIQVHWFGSLHSALAERENPPVSLSLSEPTPLTDVLERLDIPKGLVQLVMVNHRAVSGDTVIHPRDRIALFPREYPFFVDWKDFRRS